MNLSLGSHSLILVGFATAIGVSFAVSAWAADQRAVRAIESYTFVHPAVGCYRDTKVKITTDDRALARHLDKYSKMFGDNPGDLKQMKKAAVRGAASSEKLIADRGREAYCKLALARYGSRGSLYKGLVVEKR